MSDPLISSTWYLQGEPAGEVLRERDARNFYVLCPKCGEIWAKCSAPGLGWTTSHKPCVNCGSGSLVGADWASKPYAPYNLPHQLLLRELELATCAPTKYNTLS